MEFAKKVLSHIEIKRASAHLLVGLGIAIVATVLEIRKAA